MMRWTKTAAETLRYRFDWRLVLADGEEIASSAWTVPEGIDESDPANTETTADITLAGGTADRSYTVTNTVTTTVGNTLERSARLAIVATR